MVCTVFLLAWQDPIVPSHSYFLSVQPEPEYSKEIWFSLSAPQEFR